MSQQSNITSLIQSTIDVLNMQEVKGFINVEPLKYYRVLVKMYELTLAQYNYREENYSVSYKKQLTNLQTLEKKIDCIGKNTYIKVSRDKFYNSLSASLDDLSYQTYIPPEI